MTCIRKPTMTSGTSWKRLPVLVALSFAGVFAIPATSGAPAIAIAAAALPIVLAPLTTNADPAKARRRCASCGRVQSIRRVEPTGAEPLSYEFTVRLYGGLLHTSSSPSAGSWQVGDRIILIGAAAP
jgi:hypothetical protein